MNTRVLIDAIVQQTTVLLAQLSTAAGIRAPLAHIADQVFLDLAREIERQGVSRKVVADMFGLALRTYQHRVRRLDESASMRNRTLWQAVYDYTSDHSPLTREDIDRRFARDPSDHVGAVLHDLVRSGLVYASGRGKHARYRVVPLEDRASADQSDEGLGALVWAWVHRQGPSTPEALASTLGLETEHLRPVLDGLVADGRLSWVGDPHASTLDASGFLLPVGAEHGWEGAVFDHFSAVASAIAAKVQAGPGAKHRDRIGGATLTFDVHPEHPHHDDVLALLERTRSEVNALWDEVVAHNRAHPAPPERVTSVTFYFGQNVEPADPADPDADPFLEEEDP